MPGTVVLIVFETSSRCISIAALCSSVNVMKNFLSDFLKIVIATSCTINKGIQYEDKYLHTMVRIRDIEECYISTELLAP